MKKWADIYIYNRPSSVQELLSELIMNIMMIMVIILIIMIMKMTKNRQIPWFFSQNIPPLGTITW